MHHHPFNLRAAAAAAAAAAAEASASSSSPPPAPPASSRHRPPPRRAIRYHTAAFDSPMSRESLLRFTVGRHRAPSRFRLRSVYLSGYSRRLRALSRSFLIGGGGA